MKNYALLLLVAVFAGVVFFNKNSPNSNIQKPILNETKQKTHNKQKTQPTNNEGIAHFVYFTGIGCPHCAKVDPILLKHKVRQNDVMIIEYEIYKSRGNAPLLMSYNDKYGSGFGVPLLIAGKEASLVGDTAILKNFDQFVNKYERNNLPIINGEPSFMMANLKGLKGLPKIWYKNRIAVREQKSDASEEIKQFLLEGVVPENAERIETKSVELSGGKVNFKNAVAFDGWLLMWD